MSLLKTAQVKVIERFNGNSLCGVLAILLVLSLRLRFLLAPRRADPLPLLSIAPSIMKISHKLCTIRFQNSAFHVLINHKFQRKSDGTMVSYSFGGGDRPNSMGFFSVFVTCGSRSPSPAPLLATKDNCF